jgi:hypothetical protein
LPCRRRKRSPTCLFVLPLRSAPDRCSLRRLDFARSSRPLAKRLPLQLIARWTVDGMRSTISSPTAHSRPTRPSSSGATSMFGLCLSTSAPTVALVPAELDARRGAAALRKRPRLRPHEPRVRDGSPKGGDASRLRSGQPGPARGNAVSQNLLLFGQKSLFQMC